MKVKHTRQVQSITFETEDLRALADVFEAARKWIDLGTSPGSVLAALTMEDIAAARLLISRVFMAFEGEE